MRDLPMGRSVMFMVFGSLSAVTSGVVQRAFLLAGVLWMVVIVAFDLIYPANDSPANVAKPKIAPLTFLALAFVVVAAQDVWQTAGVSDALIRSTPVFAMVVIASVAAGRGLTISRESLAIGLVLNLVISVLVGFARGAGTSPCRADKCSPIGALYRGGFSHENLMGYSASLAFLAVVGLMLERKIQYRVGLVAMSGSLLALALSGARTSFFALVLAIAIYPAVRPAVRNRMKIGAAVPIASAILGLYLISSAEFSDFSFRGRRWVLIRESLDGVLSLFGGGLSAWADLQPELFEPTSTHSVYGVLLVHGGLVAVAPFVMFLVAAARQAQSGDSPYFVVLVHFVAIQAIMETIWNPTSLSPRFWVFIAIGLAAGSRSTASSLGPVDERDKGDTRQHNQPSVRSAS